MPAPQIPPLGQKLAYFDGGRPLLMTFFHRIQRVLLNLLTNNPFILSASQLPYFYETDIQPESTRFTLSEVTSKHCVQVLRMEAGDALQLTDGKGLLATAELTIAHKKHSQVAIKGFTQEPPTDRPISIAIAPTKSIHRIEWTLEKLTEIGIQEIILMRTQRTERTTVKPERLQQILISATLQSRQVFVPKLTGLINFEDLLGQYKDFTHKWIAHCQQTGNKKYLSRANRGESNLILIGPEGDFSDQEINQALAPENRFEPVTLGNTRLRTETAGLVAGVLLKI